MKVAFVSFAFGEYSIRIASELADHAEIALWLAANQAAPHADLIDRRVDFRPIDKPRMRQPIRQLREMTRIHRQLREYNPDVIHLQQGYLWFNPLLPLLRRYPLVVTVHDPTPHYGDRLGRKTPQFVADIAYRNATATVVHNDEMKGVMVSRGTPEQQIHVIPHVSLGEDGYEPSPAPAAANQILFFGRIWPYKGLDYLIRAEPLIAEEVPDARIVIAGTGENMAHYLEMMVNPDRFEVINDFIPADMVADLFRAASVVALPYVDATQSGVIPMAYSHAVPVVATNVGGLPSQVEDGRTGYLVPPRDEVALARAIIKILKDPELRRQFGANARRKTETELSPAQIAVQTLAVYQTATRGS